MTLPRPTNADITGDESVLSPRQGESSLLASERGSNRAKRLETDASNNLQVVINGAVSTTGGLTDAQLRASAVPVSVAGVASAANQVLQTGYLAALNSLTPSIYDYISLGYTGSNVTTVIYKLGGASGATISTLTLGYNGSDLISVTRT